MRTTERVRETTEHVDEQGGRPAPNGLPTGWAADFCAFDLETTGVDPHSGRIVSAALVPFVGGDEGPARTWLVDPGVEIPEAAQRVHGISTERARADGEPTAVALPQIMDAVRALSASGTTLVGHNIVYDLTVLAAEAVRAGILPSPMPCSRISRPYSTRWSSIGRWTRTAGARARWEHSHSTTACLSRTRTTHSRTRGRQVSSPSPSPAPPRTGGNARRRTPRPADGVEAGSRPLRCRSSCVASDPRRWSAGTGRWNA